MRPNPDELISQEDIETGSEFGGVGGIIQPPPHNPSADDPGEMLMLIYGNPSDEIDAAGVPTSTFTAPDTRLIKP